MSMRMSIRMKGVPEARAYYEKVDKDIVNGSSRTTHNVLLAGRAHARSIAPISTGAMIRAIKFKTIKKTTGYLISDQPDHPVTGKSVAYHWFMHNHPGAKHWRGDPQFMFTTYNYLSKEFPKQMNDMVTMAVHRKKTAVLGG